VLTFTATNDNNALFSAQPAVASNGTLTFTPADDAFGAATVTLSLGDDGGTTGGGVNTSAPVELTITVSPVGDDPTAVADAYNIAENSTATALPVLANDSIAPDTGETLTITEVSDPDHGTTVITGGGSGLTYEPDTDYAGADSFTYTISDGNGGTASAEVTMTVTNVNTAPTAGDDLATVAEDSGATAIAVLTTTPSPPIWVRRSPSRPRPIRQRHRHHHRRRQRPPISPTPTSTGKTAGTPSPTTTTHRHRYGHGHRHSRQRHAGGKSRRHQRRGRRQHHHQCLGQRQRLGDRPIAVTISDPRTMAPPT
jgi:hypothetical protein